MRIIPGFASPPEGKKKKCGILVALLMLQVCAAGCLSPARRSEASDDAYPPVDAVLTNLDVMIESVTNLATTLQAEYASRYPDGPPLKFNVHLQDSFTPAEWTELAPNYYVWAVSSYTCPDLRFRFTDQSITVAQVLSVVSEHSGWNWWTYRDTLVIEPSDPMFQPALLDYGAPHAEEVLALTLAHLFSDPRALADARTYIHDFGEDDSPPVLRRIIMPRASLPAGFSVPDLGVPVFHPRGEYDLQIGELYVRPHRVLPRGASGFRVDLFVTGSEFVGGGWFTYTFTKESGVWKPKYHGFYDP